MPQPPDGPCRACGSCPFAYVDGEAWDTHVLRVAGVLHARLAPARRRLVVRVWTGPLHFYSVRYDAADAGVSGVYSEAWSPATRRAVRITHYARLAEWERDRVHGLVDRALFQFRYSRHAGTYINVGMACGALSSVCGFCASHRTLEGDAHEFSFFAGTADGFDAFGASCDVADAVVHTYAL